MRQAILAASILALATLAALGSLHRRDSVRALDAIGAVQTSGQMGTRTISVTLLVAQDSYVAEGRQAMRPAGSDTSLQVGSIPEGQEVVERRSLLQFDLGITDMDRWQIERAELELYLFDAGGETECTITASHVISSWTESDVVWNTRPAFDRQVSSASVANVDGLQVWLLDPEVVRAWVDDPDSNHGVVLRTESENCGWRYFRSSDSPNQEQRPRLVLHVVDPEATTEPTPSVTISVPTEEPTTFPTPTGSTELPAWLPPAAATPIPTMVITADVDTFISTAWSGPVGRELNLLVGNHRSWDTTRTLLGFKWDSLDLAELTVRSATLALWQVTATLWEDRPSIPIDVYHYRESWSEDSAIWDTVVPPKAEYHLSRTEAGSQVPSWIEWELPSRVVQGADSDSPPKAASFLVDAPGDHGLGRAFSSREADDGAHAPRLLIDYRFPDEPWVDLAITPSTTRMAPGSRITYSIAISRSHTTSAEMWLWTFAPQGTIPVRQGIEGRNWDHAVSGTSVLGWRLRPEETGPFELEVVVPRDSEQTKRLHAMSCAWVTKPVNAVGEPPEPPVTGLLSDYRCSTMANVHLPLVVKK